MPMNIETYMCPKCDADVSVEASKETGRCENCGTAFAVSRDADFVNGRFQDRTVLNIVPCDCHMRSQHHEPMCPSHGPV